MGVMGNFAFIDSFPTAHACFQPYGVSDHCPCILNIPNVAKAKPRSFKFANFLMSKPAFIDIVKSKWGLNIHGVHQFRLVKKLRSLKSPLRSLLFQQGNLHAKVKALRGELELVQEAIDAAPFDLVLRDKEVRS
jgi:hypothetical protein